ncbi:hypothetical protein F511_01154 [Dorcoceras hygrometricum]|nr:hypothetical protein F511_01154 [Dorcoceras hygrometricum]
MGSNPSTESNYKTSVNSKNKRQMLCMRKETKAQWKLQQNMWPRRSYSVQQMKIQQMRRGTRYGMSCDDISLDVITISRCSEAQTLKRRLSNPKAGLYNTQKLIPDVASKRCVPT